MSVSSQDVVVRQVRPFAVAKAVAASLWKSAFIKDTFVRDRRVFEKYQRSVIGDMAKATVKEWLEENNFSVVDWDDVRTSWRSYRKPYDLQVNAHNIEVRCSISKYPNIPSLIQNEHIIYPSNVRVKEIVIQVFFSEPSCSELWLCGWTWGKILGSPSLKQYRRVAGRNTPFYLMPFNHKDAHPMADLLQYL